MISKLFRNIVLLLMAIGYSQAVTATTYTVVSTLDDGSTGTLRWAINSANGANGNRIEFNISGTAPFTIVLASQLPDITKSMVIDATTQPAGSYTGTDPLVTLQGNRAVIDIGFKITGGSAGSYIKGFTVTDFKVAGVYCNRSGSYVTENVICNIGPVGSTTGCGVIITKITGCIVKSNYIGTNKSVAPGLGCTGAGIYIDGGGTDDHIIGTADSAGRGNVIAYNSYGIAVNVGDQNIISGNAIFNNTNRAIVLLSTGNISIAKPVLTSFTSGSVFGTASAGTVVEVFASNGSEQALQYLGSGTVSGSSWYVTVGAGGWTNFVATVRDASGNTSELSDNFSTIDACAQSSGIQSPVIELLAPANFSSLDPAVTNLQYRINSLPTLNSPVTDDHYHLILQVAPEIHDPVSGILSPDWTSSTGFDTDPATLTTGTFTEALSTYVTATTLPDVYYWRIGIQYELPFAGHQPVLWSQVYKFISSPAAVSIPSEIYLTDDAEHTNNINWVYGVSYLDNGLISEGIAYIDGLGKSRQVQSKMNSTNIVMAVEAAYSEEGGGTVMTLPAPIENTDISARFGYAYNFFDVYDGSDWSDFSTKDFDRDKKGTGFNTLAAPTPVDETLTGSVGNYYSAANSDSYVDAAQGYPYAYNVSYNSPLKRPMLSASGVGTDFKMTSGKEYKHFYGHPSQQELDRVYGVDKAPLEEKISRTVTYNPDGVGNISYTDNEGKLIATALTVCNAPSLKELNEDGMNSFTVNVNPLNTDVMDPTTLTKTATSTFFVPCCTTNVAINYSIDMASFQLDENVPCIKCRYDIDVKIVNEATGEIVRQYTETNYAPSSNPCEDGPEHKTIIDSDFNLCGPANYSIVRTIKPAAGLLTSALDAYNEYLESNASTLFTQFSDQYNTESNYYLLRQQKVIAPDISLTDPCQLTTSVYTGSTMGSNKGPLSSATFKYPTGITKSLEGSFYIADAGNHLIRWVNTAGNVFVLSGTTGTSGSTDGNSSVALFNSPRDVAFRESVGILTDTWPASVIVADKDNNSVRMVDASDGTTTTIASAADGINAPEGVGVDAHGIIYVASSGSNEIYKIDLSSGAAVVTEVAPASTFSDPTDVDVASDGTIYITERGASKVTKINTAGTVSTLYTFSDASTPLPSSVFADVADNLFVSDPGNNKIYKIYTASGTATVIAGTGVSGSTDCTLMYYTAPPTAKFNVPVGIYADGTSRIFIADRDNHRIRVADITSCAGIDDDYNYLYYPDLVTVNDISTGSYTKELVNLDGDADADGTIGDEAYKLTGMTLDPATINSSSPEWIAFVNSYLRVHGLDLTSNITSIEGYSISSGSQLATGYPTSVAAMDENGSLDAGVPMDAWLLKVTFVKPSCAAACAGINYAPSVCADQCHEQRLALKAYMDDAYTTMSTSTYPYSFMGLTVNLQFLVSHFYPLNSFWLSHLTSADLTNYANYQATRMAYEIFDEGKCTDLCEGVHPGACEMCEPVYSSCVEGNVSDLYAKYQHYLAAWDNPGTNPHFPDPPYEYTDLIHGSGPTAYADAGLSSLLGAPLLHLIADNIADPAYLTRSNWNAKGGFCPSCQAMGSVSPSCGPAVPRNMSDFPTFLLPLLADMNAACQEQYDGCLQLNGTATQQNDYLCLQNKNSCIDALGEEPTPTGSGNPLWVTWNTQYTYCQSEYVNCTTNVSHPTSVDIVRSDMIHAMLIALYPLASQAGTVSSLQSSLETSTSTMTMSELEQYLADYGDEQECILDCEQELIDAFNQWMTEQKANAANHVNQAFIEGCYNNAHEALSLSYSDRIYHYTLYNYDFANNLVSTVPPEGIDYIDLTSPAEYTASPRASRVPAHRMLSTYKSTSLYTITTSAPDEGQTRYLYDVAGRLRFSQTAEQKDRGLKLGYTIFSYVKYDNDYRVIESGEYRDIKGDIRLWSSEDCLSPPCLYAYPGYSVESKVDVSAYPNTPAYTFEETYVVYDNPTLAAGVPSTAYTQKYLQGRVSRTYNRDATTNAISSVTHYSYDAHGRVTFVVQELPVFGTGLAKYKTVDYVYQALSSRVDQIIYQKGNVQEEFRQRFTYDSDYRITQAEISRDQGANWIPSAEYEYYLHGPLKRTGLGDKIQDLDYVYNINGWLKAINNPLKEKYENDNNESTSGSPYFAPDVFSEAINYYQGDYKRTGVGLDASQLSVPQAGTHLFNNAKDLFSGNISSTITNTAFNLSAMGSPPDNILAQGYSYDYLNRLTDVYAEVQNEDFGSFLETSSAASTDYASHISYDANGNIESFVRNTLTRTVLGTPTNEMDNMSYMYAQNTTDYHGNTKKLNNRLAHVHDVAVDEAGLDDIKEQDDPMYPYDAATSNTHNYQYDPKGRIIADKKSGIQVEWTASDKVKQITKADGTIISFTYNAQQQRLTKKVDPLGTKNDITTIYSYDASGILMATYEYSYNVGYKYKLLDHQMYGMGRIGTYDVNEYLVTSPGVIANDASKQLFEITDHLGSVRAVVTGVKNHGDATVVQLSDYHAFGMTMQGRSFNPAYRYGYQGSEKDGDVNSGMYTTAFRALDVRLGRWFSPDPITHPSFSPYSSMDNNPINITDPMGLEGGPTVLSPDGAPGRTWTPDRTIGGVPDDVGSADYVWDPSASFSIGDISGTILWLMNNNPGLWLKSVQVEDQYAGGPTAWEAAHIAKDVYHKDKGNGLVGGWVRMNVDIDGVVWEDTGVFRSDFQSGLYQRELNDGTFEYVYATRGTEGAVDWVTDFKQFLVGNAKQYQISVNNARLIKQYLNGESLTFVGHSLGGGLAIANSMATDEGAVVFNPAPLSTKTINNLELGYQSKAHVWVVEGEAITAVHAGVGVTAQGKDLHTLKTSYIFKKSPLQWFKRIVGHFMDTVIELMNAQGYEYLSPQAKQ